MVPGPHYRPARLQRARAVIAQVGGGVAPPNRVGEHQLVRAAARDILCNAGIVAACFEHQPRVAHNGDVLAERDDDVDLITHHIRAVRCRGSDVDDVCGGQPHQLDAVATPRAAPTRGRDCVHVAAHFERVDSSGAVEHRPVRPGGCKALAERSNVWNRVPVGPSRVRERPVVRVDADQLDAVVASSRNGVRGVVH